MNHRRTGSKLRAELDRVDAAEEALDDTVAVNDPRVAQAAAERHAFETALMGVIEESASWRRTTLSSPPGTGSPTAVAEENSERAAVALTAGPAAGDCDLDRADLPPP